jgi:hypothetical protein
VNGVHPEYVAAHGLHRQSQSTTTLNFPNGKTVVRTDYYVDHVDPYSPVKGAIKNRQRVNQTIAFEGFTREEESEFLMAMQSGDNARMDAMFKKHST